MHNNWANKAPHRIGQLTEQQNDIKKFV